jgi:tRNA-dependent cyclodipeptide synthase
MRIESYLNVTQEEVDSRQHNIWIGVSLGNKYFTKDNIRAYIQWSLAKTKDTVLVIIADALQAINLEVLDHRTKPAAQRKAMKMGNEKYAEVQEIISQLPAELAQQVHLARWSDVVEHENYKRSLDIAQNYYKTNLEFRNYIIEAVKVGRPDRTSRLLKLTTQELDRLADYILNELPHFIDGVQGYDERVYTLIPYPGLTILDELFVGINTKTMFPELAEKLNIKNHIGILEAYTE